MQDLWMQLRFRLFQRYLTLIKPSSDATNTDSCTRPYGTLRMFQDFDWETCKQKIIEEVLKL